MERRELAVTRFAGSSIQQNSHRLTCRLTVRVAIGKRMGAASGEAVSPASAVTLADRACLLAGGTQPSADFTTLPAPVAMPVEALSAEVMPPVGRRAGVVAEVVAVARDRGYTASGVYAVDLQETAVANSLGIEAFQRICEAGLRTVVAGPNGTGYAAQHGPVWARLDAQAVAAEAVARCERAQGPGHLPPGRYDTVFLPYAVADIIRFPAYLGFSALALQEGSSFLAGRLGEQIVGGNISLWDDASDPRGIVRGFDVEGVAKQRVELFTEGVATGVVWDSFTAHRSGRYSTGHAQASRWGPGPLPANLVLAPGGHSLADLIGGTSRGLLVTRFHQSHCPDPRAVAMTGTTRDGLFLIEGGRLAGPVRDLRLDDSVLNMLRRVSGSEDQVRLAGDHCGTFLSLLPALKIDDVNYASAAVY